MKPIWHIYYGTRGTAGNYIDCLLNASDKAGIKSIAFVSSKYNYKTKNCIKCFFPITDQTEKRNNAILTLRALELLTAYIFIALYATLKRPKINLHLIDDLKITYFMLKYFKLIRLELYVTCHDVRSHYCGETELRAIIMNMADKLIVHNKNAKVTLTNTIEDLSEIKINSYPFPFSSYEEIINKDKMEIANETLFAIIPQDKPYFLFLGVVRNSKGIESLLNAWVNSDAKKTTNLVIAGKWAGPSKATRKIADYEDSCIVIDRYVSDEEFVTLIDKSHFVVLPYLNYAHSSILYSSGYHNGAVINSDIELFKETMPDYPLVFKNGNVNELIEILNKTAIMSKQDVNKYRTLTKNAIQNQKDDLVRDLKLVYAE